MGWHHAWYCAGCCWALFALLFPLGIMNVGAMAFVTLLIFAEKSLPRGREIGVAAAVGIIAFGVLVIAEPALLPTAM